MPSSMSRTDDLPSLLWITIPPVVLLSAYFVRKWYLARRLKLYGIGKGAPGFQTNVRQVRVTPEIAARIRKGEDVSPAEIEAASRAADEREALEASNSNNKKTANLSPSSNPFPGGLPRGVIEERDDRHLINSGKTNNVKKEEDSSSANEWLPESITKPSKRRKGRR
ncbi:hypothetical protein M413DRAFT_444719 [Hebeloma cylindrosporum]|uniref:Uncharacterized protein n=1 Tax=Hebeloma cylindrosporum TaxID=76867 RepID=A0A0C3CF95_HEBCY|nr:hypothetical protein M413DRAFT_444719 [Hebeloma cylindrosporum h7]